MEEKMVRCTEFGFSSEELRGYVAEKLNMLEEKTNVEGLTESSFGIMRAAFESEEVQELVDQRKAYVKVPEPFLRAFNVKPEIWKADIPFSAVVSAIDKEISALYEQYGVTEE